MISLTDIQKAYQEILGVVHVTPIEYSQTFSKSAKNNVFLKLENLQKTGSFKVRGSYNKIHSLTEEERSKGVIAASAGNHAQGVAYSSTMLHIPCTIVMPKGAPLSKVRATEGYGATVILYGDTFDESLQYALQLKEERDLTFIHPYDDDSVIAGQGTIGLEILKKRLDIDAIVCPVGGGGLLAGVAIAAKSLNPNIKVYGVESSACPGMTEALKNNGPTLINSTYSLADGIAVKKPGELTYQYISQYVDDIFCVEEADIARAMLSLLERNKLLVEGAGACTLAAIMQHKLPVENKNVVAILSGGNVDVTLISRIIEHGLAESGRFLTFSTILPDRPGQLNKLLDLFAQMDANIMEIEHSRTGARVMPGYVDVRCSIGTKDRNHIDMLLCELQKQGYQVCIHE